MVFALALGEIIEQLKGEVKNISKDRKYKVNVKGKAYDVVLHPDTEDGFSWVECPASPAAIPKALLKRSVGWASTSSMSNE